MSLSTEIKESVNGVAGEEKEDNVQHIVDMVNLSDISSIKQSVSAIIRVINDPGSTVKELKEVIQLDPPLAAKVLKTANSAYYSRSFTRTFTDIEQAIIWIGTEIIKELALNQKVCEIFDRDERIEEYSRKTLWHHSVAVALTAKFIYRREYGLKGENAYAAGLLHDIGMIAEDQFLQDDFRTILQLSKTKSINITSAERETWGFDHAQVGEAITASWGLPEELNTAVGYHNNPLNSCFEFSKLVYTLYVSDYFCQNNGFGFGAVPDRDRALFNECLRLMDVKPHALEIILKNVKQEIKTMQNKGLL
ncbi:MAG: HDOD domain-containing protein [Candidatus Aminicenantes bacterium]|nr:HDOD domain-containing protein [Candidatus Aminicenantes bacterium]NIM83275.1 HDOD domain-containing protein [Candidatus Aminicenantes bacterium]NIN22646.1 HDOD domain-containing protein [Candidatus Aminicenantes bacterium]NIN46405.1 HDOD domain-containing protein [Candidatus Aminicenantes bacterium]NIN89255.1 HDOD domain-containing protein [Candidatus Aminicenantes bacterium]